MSFLSKKLFYPNRIRIICFICVVSILLPACKKKVLEEMNSFDFKSKLSEYAIFQGEMKALKPSANFHLYELSSTLYTDMAEKQRLVFLPPGSLVTVNGNGPVDFPEGTILVKTFYYFNDKRDPSLGLKIQETRLLIKSKNTWAVATYRWNEAQTDAQLLSSGFSQYVNWTDDTGKARALNYSIPSNNACVTCHHQSGKTVPIGTKIQNLNRLVLRDGDTVNQLEYLMDAGIFPALNSNDFLKLPDSNDETLDIKTRARSYFEVNCAHCHQPEGYAASEKVNLLFETPESELGLGAHAIHLNGILEKGKMPKLGNNTVDEKGVALMKAFLDDLN